jgi:DNA-binding transcriptional LysR family regulator
MMPHVLDGMALFVAVAEARNFRIAGERLGVSASAVSQSLRKLEERLGVPLVHRTTRSVSLSEAGERLYAAVRPALAEVEAAVAAVGELSDEPRGTIRLLIGTTADPVLVRLPLADFLAAHPHVGLDVVVRDEVAREELVPVLQAFCEPFPGFYLYYPQRRHASPALRALIDHLRRARLPASGRKPGAGSPGARPRRR